MTREEAINNLESLYNEVYNEDSDGYNYAIALDMAIEVLHDVIESQNNIIKKPRTVRYKLHKPIEYVSIEFDEEEVITHIEHYNEVVRCKDCRFNKHPSNDLCLIKKAGIYPDDDDFCSYGEKEKK